MCARDKASEGIRPFAPDMGRLPNGKVPRIVQYYRLKQKHSALRGGQPPKPAVRYTPDWLSIMTAKTRICLQFLVKVFTSAEKQTPLRRYLPSSNFLASITIPIVLATICSSLIYKRFAEIPEERNKLWIVFYLVAFATHFGAQIWMTFVSGLVLYFNLSRHVFGQVQEVIFPFFYMFNGIVSFVQIIAYINTQARIYIYSKEMVQVLVMSVTLLIELYIRLFIAHQIVLLKHKKTRIEAEAGTGQEIGHHVLGELANCPHYMGILRKFRRLHSYTSIATIITVICSAYHVNYLTDRLCI